MGDVDFGVEIDLDDNTASGLKKISKQFAKMTKGVTKALGAIAKIAIPALTAAIGFSIKAAEEQQRVLAQMDATLQSTGNAVGLTKAQIVGLSQELQTMTGIGDEVIQSGQNMLLTFTNLKGEAFEGATKTLLDMNVAMTGGKVTAESMRQQAIQLGKALNNPIEGITALTRVGVKFTDAQKEQIKVLTAAGKVQEAQAIILKELNTEFGGSAEALGKTFGGQVKGTMAAVGDLGEQIGSALIPILQNNLIPAARKATAWLKDFLTPKRIATWIKNFKIGVASAKLGFKAVGIAARTVGLSFGKVFAASDKGWRALVLSARIAALKIKGIVKDTTAEQIRLQEEFAEQNRAIEEGIAIVSDEITQQKLDAQKQFYDDVGEANIEFNKLVKDQEKLTGAFTEQTIQTTAGLQTDAKNAQLANINEVTQAHKKAQTDKLTADAEYIANLDKMKEEQLKKEKTRLEQIVNAEKTSAIERADALKKLKKVNDILIDARLAKEKALSDNLLKSWQDSYDAQKSIVENYAASVKELMKNLIIDYLKGLQADVAASTAAGIARAVAAKDFGSAAVIAAEGAAAGVAIEAAIGSVRGLRSGGVVEGRGIFELGEENKREAVIPLETPAGRRALKNAIGEASGGGSQVQNVTLVAEDGMVLGEWIANNIAEGRDQGRF